MQEMVKAHLIITGRVQGVFFRAETQKAAVECGVCGWVRNKPDGTVEAVVEGAAGDVNALLKWCRTGPPLSDVERVDVAWQDYQAEYDKFSIKF